jgi:hypothetical protein
MEAHHSDVEVDRLVSDANLVVGECLLDDREDFFFGAASA